jgi:glycosyl transferase domain protein
MMSQEPLVSVLIPCYNCEKYVEKAVTSIIEQSYSNLEILVIDDGSTDNTGSILQELAQKDSRIRYIKNETNLKLIKTLNKGIDLCRGKYIARMDADDISLPTRIVKQVNFLEKHPDIGIVGTYTKNFGANNRTWKMKTRDKFIRAHLFFNTCFAHPSVMIRTSVLRDNHLYYDTNYLHAEDYKLWCDIAQYTKLANIPEILLYYRINQNQISNKYSKEQKETAQKIREEYINDFLAKKEIPIKFSAQTTIDDIRRIGSYIKEKYILKKILLAWYDSLSNKKEILRSLTLTSANVFEIGLIDGLKILFHKVIKK